MQRQGGGEMRAAAALMREERLERGPGGGFIGEGWRWRGRGARGGRGEDGCALGRRAGCGPLSESEAAARALGRGLAGAGPAQFGEEIFF